MKYKSCIGFVFFLVICTNCLAKYSGRIIDWSGNPLSGTVVYDLTDHALKIQNNKPFLTEQIPRTISDNNGIFELNNNSRQLFILLKNIYGHYAFFTLDGDRQPLDIMMPKAAQLTGKLMEGPNPVPATEIQAYFLPEGEEAAKRMRYNLTAKTNKKGIFKFKNLLPGKYSIHVSQEVPQVGCCFNQVITKQKLITLAPGQKREVTLGGTDLPSLHGRMTSADELPLHGVWIQLLPKGKDPNLCSTNGQNIWAAVTDPNGNYNIYDIPPGQYEATCYRRLAGNSYSKTFKKTLDVNIVDLEQKRNNFDIKVDLEPFMPLKYGSLAPDIEAKLLDGTSFKLSDHKGKVVVLYFYISTCRPCVSSIDYFEELHKKYQDRAKFVCVNLDKTLFICDEFTSKKGLTLPQIYNGPAQQNSIAKAYKISEVPTSFIIDANGNIAQIDLFGPTLEKFIDENLLNNSN